MVSQKRRTVARLVGDLIGSHPKVSSVLVFGSVASGYVDERSDVDILAVCSQDILSVTEREGILSQIGLDWAFHDLSHYNALFADIDSDGIVNGVRVTLHYQTVSWISEVLAEVLDQGAITTEKLPFRPYTLPALIQRAWLLLDRDEVVRKWREKAKVYPRKLKLNIISYFIPILRGAMEELRASAERSLGPRLFIFWLDRAVNAMVSILFALNEVYDPAERRAERTVLPKLGCIPTDFIRELTCVLVGPFDDVGALYRAKVFEELATQVLAMAEHEATAAE